MDYRLRLHALRVLQRERIEAVELRDGIKARYNGKGVLKAVSNVNDIIGPALVGKNPEGQVEIDNIMISLDGSPNKGRLGANAIIAVSLAVSRLAALYLNMPLYTYLGKSKAFRVPVP